MMNLLTDVFITDGVEGARNARAPSRTVSKLGADEVLESIVVSQELPRRRSQPAVAIASFPRTELLVMMGWTWRTKSAGVDVVGGEPVTWSITLEEHR